MPTVQKYTINSNLIGKEEAFKILALGTSTELPVLLLGEKGTAKTATALQFAQSYLGQLGTNESFVIELSHDTKKSELLGQPDMQSLVQKGEWIMNRPICDAKVVVINEVDKASTSVRNICLSVMSEQEVHDGKYSQKCNWKTFVATANEINKGEEGLPFWDRFAIKYKMPKVTKDELLKFMKSDKKLKPIMEIAIPTKSELESASLDFELIDIFLTLLDEQARGKEGINFSDRAKTKLEILVKAAKHIWELGDVDATLKIAELFAPSIVVALGKKMDDPLVTEFKSLEEQFINSSQTAIARNSILVKMKGLLDKIQKNAIKNENLRDKHKVLNMKYEKYHSEQEKALDFNI